MPVRSLLPPLVWATSLTLACANVAPTAVIQSAAMRPGTTLMDVVYRVNDPDDATVKVRALAFVDGVRSFANVLRPVTFVEGTVAKLGNAIPSNTNHTLTWDVAADWNIDLGQVKFEVLAMDGRGLVAFDWITIPAANGQPALTLSKDTPDNSPILDGLFWRYADGDTGLTLGNGVLRGGSASGDFTGVALANGVTPDTYAAPYLFKQMNLAVTGGSDLVYANTNARAGILNTSKFHASNRTYDGLAMVVGWGKNNYGQATAPAGLTGIIAVSASADYSLALKSDGRVVFWGQSTWGQSSVPAGLTGVIAISAGVYHCLALKSDGTVVGWGKNYFGEATTPAGLTGVIAIAAGTDHSLALKSNGTVVAWGSNENQQIVVPTGLTGVIGIAAGEYHSLALKSNGTVVGWGWGMGLAIPSGLTGVTAISSSYGNALALKSNGTVVAWGFNNYGENGVPAGLSGVIAIASGGTHSLALKNDGTVVGWGSNDNGQTTIPTGLAGVTAISTGVSHSLAFKPKVP